MPSPLHQPRLCKPCAGAAWTALSEVAASGHGCLFSFVPTLPPPCSVLPCRLGLAEYEAMEAFVIYDPEHPARLFKAPLPSGKGAAAALKSSALADQPGCSEHE